MQNTGVFHKNVLYKVMLTLHYTEINTALSNTHTQNTHTHCHFTALCLGLPTWASTRRPVPEETFTHSRLKHVVGVCHHSGFYEARERY